MSKILDTYIKTSTMLTFAEEQQLGQNGDIDKQIEALILANIKLVYKQAQHFRKIINRNIDFDELVGRGTYGLQIAARRFDFKRKIKFSTFAFFYIKKYMVMYLNNETRNGTISDDNKTAVISLDLKIFDDKNSEKLYSVIPDKTDINESLSCSNDKKLLFFLLDEFLNDRERYIIKYRFLADQKLTLHELALNLGISQASVKSLETHCLKKLRAAFEIHK